MKYRVSACVVLKSLRSSQLTWGLSLLSKMEWAEIIGRPGKSLPALVLEAFVSFGSPRQLLVWNLRSLQPEGSGTFPVTVLGSSVPLALSVLQLQLWSLSLLLLSSSIPLSALPSPQDFSAACYCDCHCHNCCCGGNCQHLFCHSYPHCHNSQGHQSSHSKEDFYQVSQAVQRVSQATLI